MRFTPVARAGNGVPVHERRPRQHGALRAASPIRCVRKSLRLALRLGDAAGIRQMARFRGTFFQIGMQLANKGASPWH